MVSGPGFDASPGIHIGAFGEVFDYRGVSLLMEGNYYDVVSNFGSSKSHIGYLSFPVLVKLRAAKRSACPNVSAGIQLDRRVSSSFSGQSGNLLEQATLSSNLWVWRAAFGVGAETNRSGANLAADVRAVFDLSASFSDTFERNYPGADVVTVRIAATIKL